MSGRTPLIERAFEPFRRFFAIESAGGLVLLFNAALALAWANSPFADSYHHLWETEIVVGAGSFAVRATLHHLINDGLMAVFFFLVGLEIKREVLAGELSTLRSAALPMAGALGGMLVPAALYALINARGPGAAGWGIPMATDIAFALGVLALFGRGIPPGLRVFLAALAIVDDIGAVLVIALFYAGGIVVGPLVAAGALLCLAVIANRVGVRSPWAYAVIGLALWGAVFASGVHATVAGVLLAMAIPARTRIDERSFLSGAREALAGFEQSCAEGRTILTNQDHQYALHHLQHLTDQAQAPLARLEQGLHGVVAFIIMPLFALANAGVSLGGVGAELARHPVVLGVAAGLVIGKPLGISLLSWLAVRLGLAQLPEGVTWRGLYGVAALAGIGFTMSLFIAGLAFRDAGLLQAAKLGILGASLVAGLAGWILLHGMRTGPAAVEGA